jgi:CRISPR/Cas system-associated protein Csm6
MRQQLKIQAQAHSDHLVDVLDVKEKELERHFNRVLNERLEQEQSAYKMQISAMLGRLRGMEDALKRNISVVMRIIYFISNQNTSKFCFNVLTVYSVELC